MVSDPFHKGPRLRLSNRQSLSQKRQSVETSNRSQPAHGAGAGGEPVDLQPESLEHRHVQVRQRIVLLRVEGQMPACLKPPPASSTGRLTFEWALALPMQVP